MNVSHPFNWTRNSSYRHEANECDSCQCAVHFTALQIPVGWPIACRRSCALISDAAQTRAVKVRRLCSPWMFRFWWDSQCESGRVTRVQGAYSYFDHFTKSPFFHEGTCKDPQELAPRARKKSLIHIQGNSNSAIPLLSGALLTEPLVKVVFLRVNASKFGGNVESSPSDSECQSVCQHLPCPNIDRLTEEPKRRTPEVNCRVLSRLIDIHATCT
jgi:hypothetical protein